MAQNNPQQGPPFVYTPASAGTPYPSTQQQYPQQYAETGHPQQRLNPEAANESTYSAPPQSCPVNPGLNDTCNEPLHLGLLPSGMQQYGRRYMTVETPPPTPVLIDSANNEIFDDGIAFQREQLRDIELNYNMPNAEIRGVGFIFINTSFPNISLRPGTNKDLENIKEIFHMMRLKIEIFENLTREGISTTLEQCGQYFEGVRTHLFCVAFSTHGNQEDYLYCSDGLGLSLRRDIVPHFKPDKCPSLQGVPKVFLVQACRGEKIDKMRHAESDAMVKDENVSLESDFLISYACPPDHKAFRSEEEGAWFLSDLNQAFKQYSDKYHFLDILTITNHLLLKRTNSNLKSGRNMAQSSHIDSTLKKFLFIKSENHVTGGTPSIEISRTISQNSTCTIDSSPQGLVFEASSQLQNIESENKTDRQQSDSTPTNSLPKDNIASDLFPRNVYDFEQQDTVLGELIQKDKLFLKKTAPKCKYLQSYDLGGDKFKGLGIIIVNQEFPNNIRQGSKSDCDNLEYIFKGLQLKIEMKKNLNAQGAQREKTILGFIQSKIEENSDMKSFFLAISTHGSKETKIIGSDGGDIEINSILELFKGAQLVGKPKIIFIQACRGENQDICEKIRSDYAEPDALSKSTKQSELLVAYACVQGFRAMRDKESGSWFVTALKECYDMLRGQSNILELLTVTNKYMLENYKEDNGIAEFRQSAEYKNTLSCVLKI